jgi:hypothetical protein
MGLRFAAGIPALTRALKDIFPAKSGKDYASLALRFGPELLGAGLVASSLPVGTEGGARALAAGEELATSVGLSLLGNLAGRGVARNMAARRLNNLDTKPLPEGVSPRQYAREMTDMGMNIGDVAALPLQFFVPRAFYNSQLDEYVNQQQGGKRSEAEAQDSEEDMNLALAALLTSGALGTGGMALGSGQPRQIIGGQYVS